MYTTTLRIYHAAVYTTALRLSYATVLITSPRLQTFLKQPTVVTFSNIYTYVYFATRQTPSAVLHNYIQVHTDKRVLVHVTGSKR
jgi:hypothetical protein